MFFNALMELQGIIKHKNIEDNDLHAIQLFPTSLKPIQQFQAFALY
jgi:hypothetical protein